MRVAFVIHSLQRGGSERQLTTLAAGLAAQGHDITVFVLRGGGALEAELVDRGPIVVDASRARPWYVPAGIVQLVRDLRRWRPDIVHSYLVVPNLLVALLRPFLGPARVVWGVRAAGEGRYHHLSRLAFAATSIAAHIPRLIIANSEAGRRYHLRRGYPARKTIAIENGVDAARFQRDPVGRDRVRAEWGVVAGAPLIGLVARPDPLKDHETFLRAAGEVAASDATARFVCVGGNAAPGVAGLEQLAARLGLADRLVWAPERDDMAAVYSAFDGGCLSSVSEGFPNVIAEAMACGTPCVVTDVGDAGALVDDLGVVVAPGDAPALAAGMRKLLDRVASEGDALRAAARRRVVERYSVAHLVERTAAALSQLLTTDRAT